MLGAQGICATGFKLAQGIAHCAKFESNTNRMTFEYAPNMMIVKVHSCTMSHCILGQHLECRPLDPTLAIWTNFVKEKLIYLLFFTPF